MEQLPRLVAYSWFFQPKLKLPDPPTREEADLERFNPAVIYAEQSSPGSRWLLVVIPPGKSLPAGGVGSVARGAMGTAAPASCPTSGRTRARSCRAQPGCAKPSRLSLLRTCASAPGRGASLAPGDHGGAAPGAEAGSVPSREGAQQQNWD